MGDSEVVHRPNSEQKMTIDKADDDNSIAELITDRRMEASLKI